MIIFLIVMIFVVITQAVFLPVNGAVLLLCLAIGYFSVETWVWLAFFLGVMFDLSSGGLMGKSSLVFLGLTFVFYLYSRKWTITHPLAMLLFGVGGDLVTRIAWGIPINPFEVAAVGFLSGIWGWWLKNYQGNGTIIVRR